MSCAARDSQPNLKPNSFMFLRSSLNKKRPQASFAFPHVVCAFIWQYLSFMHLSSIYMSVSYEELVKSGKKW